MPIGKLFANTRIANKYNAKILLRRGRYDSERSAGATSADAQSRREEQGWRGRPRARSYTARAVLLSDTAVFRGNWPNDAQNNHQKR